MYPYVAEPGTMEAKACPVVEGDNDAVVELCAKTVLEARSVTMNFARTAIIVNSSGTLEQ